MNPENTLSANAFDRLNDLLINGYAPSGAYAWGANNVTCFSINLKHHRRPNVYLVNNGLLRCFRCYKTTKKFIIFPTVMVPDYIDIADEKDEDAFSKFLDIIKNDECYRKWTETFSVKWGTALKQENWRE